MQQLGIQPPVQGPANQRLPRATAERWIACERARALQRAAGRGVTSPSRLADVAQDAESSARTWDTGRAIASEQLLQGRAPLVHVADVEGLAITPSPLDHLAQQDHLAWALQRLTPAERQALRLSADGFTRQEVAQAMGVAVSSVATFLKRGRAKARALLAD